MTVLVTGAAGYLGSSVVGALLDAQIHVLGADCGRRGFAGYRPYAMDPYFKPTNFDITTKAALGLSPKAVVHLAAIVGEAACKTEPKNAKRVNVDATKRLLDAYHDVPFVFVSTCSNYGVTDGEATEETPLNPISLYAETKVEAECAVIEAGGIVLRLGTLYGLNGATRWDLLVNEWSKALSLGADIEVYQPDAYRPMLCVQDAADAIWLVIENELFGEPNGLSGETFNVAWRSLTKLQIANMVMEAAPCPVGENQLKIVDKGDARNYRVSTAKWESLFGDYPYTSISEAVPALVQYGE